MENTFTQTRPSEIEWIGDIPSNWEVFTLFQLVHQVKNKNKDLEEKNLLSLSYGKIKRKDINSSDGLLPESFDGYNIIEENDIVLRLTDLQNDHTSLRVGRATERGIITSAYVTMRPIDPEISEYLYYLLHAFDLKKGFYGMGSGVRQGLTYDEVKKMKVILPPKEDIPAIVNSLHSITDKVDQLISDAQSTIDNYKKWKQSIIFEVSTGQANYDGEYKESEIEWVERIPAGWDVIPAGRYFSEVKDKNTQNEYDNPFSFKYGEIVDKSITGGIDESVMETLSTYRIVKENTIMINGLNLNYDFVTQRVALVRKKGIITSAYLAVQPDESAVFPQYATYLFKGYDGKQVFHSVGRGIRKTLKFQDFAKIKMILPPYEKQIEIADYLTNKLEEINKIVAEKEELISLLEDYKRSSIYEIVTGRRRVV